MRSVNRPTVIVVHETMWQSVASDLFTFAMLAGFIGLGVFLESTVMQWVGAIMAMFGIFAKSTNPKRLTIAEARKKLDEMEADKCAA